MRHARLPTVAKRRESNRLAAAPASTSCTHRSRTGYTPMNASKQYSRRVYLLCIAPDPCIEIIEIYAQPPGRAEGRCTPRNTCDLAIPARTGVLIARKSPFCAHRRKGRTSARPRGQNRSTTIRATIRSNDSRPAIRGAKPPFLSHSRRPWARSRTRSMSPSS